MRDPLERAEDIVRLFVERVQDAPEDFTGLGALLGLGAKAEFAGDD
jgi:hypothetical protein